MDLRYSEQSVFFINTDIEGKQKPPFHKKHYFVANHIRAVLDLLSSDQLILAQGMRRNFKCTAEYGLEIFEKVYLLKNSHNLEDISFL